MNSKNNRISVVIPAYNGGVYLRKAVESVLAQTRLPAEVLVVDDGGTEDAGGVLSGLGGVTLLRNEMSRGQGFCRNLGITRSTGDLIALCDHDDIWAPGHLEKVAELLNRFPEAPLAFSRIGLIGAASGCWPADAACVPERPERLFIPLMRNNFIMPKGTVFRRGLWNEAGPFDESHPLGVDDYRFFLEAAVRHPIVGRRDPTAFWRIHERQASRDRGPQVAKAFRHRIDMLDIHGARLRDEHLLPAAVAVTLRCWEEHIEEAWATRNMRYLREMVRFGLGESRLRQATWPYIWKAGIPNFMVQGLVAWKAIRPPRESIIQARR